MQITTSTLHKLLAALNECTEWGQVYVLDSLTEYKPSDSREAESIIERVIPRLQHANAAVVLSAVKIILLLMGHVQALIFNPSIISNPSITSPPSFLVNPSITSNPSHPTHHLVPAHFVLHGLIGLALQSTETIRHLHKKLAPPLVTLLSGEAEVQYVALRNINLIVQATSPAAIAVQCH